MEYHCNLWIWLRPASGISLQWVDLVRACQRNITAMGGFGKGLPVEYHYNLRYIARPITNSERYASRDIALVMSYGLFLKPKIMFST